ncbi:MAG: hypothetical protein GY740_01145, partial [Gammaproteobacteria bacterium]|nr:hypothetical protein [Gammaproteobacteria bacterium]
MAAEGGTGRRPTKPDVEKLFDELEKHHNTELVRLVQAVRHWDFVPSEEGVWNETIRQLDEKETTSGGTDVVKRFLKPETAASSFITTKIRTKIANYLERFAEMPRAFFPPGTTLSALGDEYRKRANDIRVVLTEEATTRAALAEGTPNDGQATGAADTEETTLFDDAGNPIVDAATAAQQEQRLAMIQQQRDDQDRVKRSQTLAVPRARMEGTSPLLPTGRGRGKPAKMLEKMAIDAVLLGFLAERPPEERYRLGQLMNSYNSQIVHVHDARTAAAAEEEINEIIDNIDYDDDDEVETPVTSDAQQAPLSAIEARAFETADPQAGAAARARAAAVRRNNERVVKKVAFGGNPRPTKDGLPTFATQDPELREEVDQIRNEMTINNAYMQNFRAEVGRTATAQMRDGPYSLSSAYQGPTP